MTLGERLSNMYTGIMHDVLRERGLGNQVLPSDIRPVSDGHHAAGIAFTAVGRLDDTLTADESLLAWTELLSAAPEGSVVVLAANDSWYAHMGELSAETLASRGVRAFVTDGGTRDVRFIRELGFPVWCRYATPADIVGRWTVAGMEERVTIGTAQIEPGDLVLGDDDGVVVIPGAVAEEVIASAEELVTTEDSVREAIRAGMSPRDAYLKYRKF
jgi:4-hydroxy-4-methyl-2-oxoglutarate aldolase